MLMSNSESRKREAERIDRVTRKPATAYTPPEDVVELAASPANETPEVPTGDAPIEHFKVCDCHDSWDQCPCGDGGHPADGSCGCCPFGIGLCGPAPVQPPAPDPGERVFTAAEVIEIANETSDSLGNLYRLDFIDRINHEAETGR